MSPSPLAGLMAMCAAPVILYLLCMHYDPKKPHARMIRHGVMGLMLLWGWNLLPLPGLGVNPISVMLAGTLGLPGLGLIAAMNLLP